MVCPDIQADTWVKYNIMLDPGHGGTDPGASGPTAPHEATLALRCANALAKKIGDLGGTYKLTRTSDVYVSLQARRQQSIDYDPYIFCSIHLNAFDGSAHGTETWYYFTEGNSKMLADYVHASLIAEMKRTNRGVKQNGWTVITGNKNIPAILTEGLFVDNVTEHNLVKTEGSAGFNNWVNGHLYGFYDRLANLNANITNPRTNTATTTPTITSSADSWRFDAEKGTTVSTTLKITGANLSSAITASLNNTSEFAISTTSLAAAGGNITVSFKPTTAGNKSATLTLKSGTVTKTVALTGVATAPALSFVEKWNFSQKNGTATYKGWDATKVRNMTYMQGKLYLVYNTADIKVVKSGTLGANDTGVLGDLNKGDVVTGGTLKLCDVKACDGKIVASNLTTSTGDPLRVYVWDNDQALPRVALETTNLGGAKRLGDCIGWRGTWNDGELVFANDDGGTTRIVTYAVKNGNISATPTVKNATTDGTTRLITGSSTRVYPQANGKYWIDGMQNMTTLLDANGKRELYIDMDEPWGNALATFEWEGSNYALSTTFKPRSGVSAENFTGGCFHLLRCDDGYAKPQFVAKYPTNGLSDTNQNTNCTQNVVIARQGTTVEAWVLSANQGIAYFINPGGTAPTYNYETIRPYEPGAPEITVSQKSLDMKANWNASASRTITVGGANLEGGITATLSGSDADRFSIGKSSFAASNGSVNAALDITFTPRTVGSFTAMLTLQSTGAEPVQIALIGTGTEIITVKEEVGEMTEMWNYSGNKGNLSQAAWFDRNGVNTRDICYVDGKLFVLNTNVGAPSEVVILDAQTGKEQGKLNITGIAASGTFHLASIKTLGNTILGCNMASAAGTLNVYAWDTPTSAPRLLLTTTNHGSVEVGRIMNTFGTMENGTIAFGAPKTAVYYRITNGTVNATPTVVAHTAADGIASSQSVEVHTDGTFIVNNSATHPMHFDATGKLIGTVADKHMSALKQGSAVKTFNYNKRRYMAATSSIGTTNWTNSTANIIDITDGVANAKTVGTYPAGGLANTSFGGVVTNGLATEVTPDNTVNMWVMVPKQGAAMYQFKGQTVTGVDNIAADSDNATAEYFTLQGIRVDGDNLAPGVYIRRTSAHTEKVLIR